MGNPPHGDHIHSTFRYSRNCINRNLTRRLDDSMAVNQPHRLGHCRRIHIVEHDNIGAAVQRRSNLVNPIHFNFDFDHVTDLSFRIPHGSRKSSSGDNMVVLDQQSIAKTKAVIKPASTAHGIFLQRA